MQRTKWMIIVAVLVILGGIGFGVARNYYSKPLGPALDLPTLTAMPVTATIQVTETVAPSAATVLPTLEPTATTQPLCGGPAQMTILAIGSDARGNLTFTAYQTLCASYAWILSNLL